MTIIGTHPSISPKIRQCAINAFMISNHHIVFIKTLTVVLAVILGLGIFANSGSALSGCSAACCMGSGATANSYHTPKITFTAPRCCCTDTAAFPCEVAGRQDKRLSPPAFLRAHQHDQRDLTVARMDVVGYSTDNQGTTGASTVLVSASILKVPIYLTTLTFLC